MTTERESLSAIVDPTEFERALMDLIRTSRHEGRVELAIDTRANERFEKAQRDTREAKERLRAIVLGGER